MTSWVRLTVRRRNAHRNRDAHKNGENHPYGTVFRRDRSPFPDHGIDVAVEFALVANDQLREQIVTILLVHQPLLPRPLQTNDFARRSIGRAIPNINGELGRILP